MDAIHPQFTQLAFTDTRRVTTDYKPGQPVVVVITPPNVIDAIRFQTEMTRMRAIEAASEAAAKMAAEAAARVSPVKMETVEIPVYGKDEEGNDTSEVVSMKMEFVEVPDPIMVLEDLQAAVEYMDRASAFAASTMLQRETEFSNLVAKISRYTVGFETVDGNPIPFRAFDGAQKPWTSLSGEEKTYYSRQLFNVFVGPVLQNLGAGCDLVELKN